MDFWWNIDPPKPRKNCPYLCPRKNAPPSVSWGKFVQPVSIPRFICIICAKFIPIRSSPLTTFHNILNCWPPITPHATVGIVGRIVFSLCPFLLAWICDPLKNRNAPWGIEGRIVFSLCPSMPRRIRRRVPHVVPIGTAVWQLIQTFECVTP